MDNNNMYDQDKSGAGAEQQQQQSQFQQPYQQQGYYQQPQYQQQPYQQPVQQNFYQQPYDNSGLEEPISIGEWLVTMLILMIPCVNIVMLFVWAFGSGTKKSKSNFFKAQLIMALVIIVLWLIIALIAFAAGASMLNSF